MTSGIHTVVRSRRSRAVNTAIGLAGILVLLGSCFWRQPVIDREIAGVGRFEFRKAQPGVKGTLIGAPYAETDLGTAALAKAASDRSGAGLVVAYGFREKRLAVEQPMVTSRPPSALLPPFERGSVFNEYKAMLQRAGDGKIGVYVGIRRAPEHSRNRIEVSTSGVSCDQAQRLKQAYSRIRDQQLRGRDLPAMPMAIEPLDVLSWRTTGAKYHGVLLSAEKGMILRVPYISSPDGGREIYADVVPSWIGEAIQLINENSREPSQVQVQFTNFGKFESMRARSGIDGIVIGAPHGSFDNFTAELARFVSCRTGFAAVIAKGFSPTEAGGWRINVNRPTEKTFPSSGPEVYSRRAEETYLTFKNLINQQSVGSLRLYVDLHGYNTQDKIQIATVGITQDQATLIRAHYYQLRDQGLKGHRGVPSLALAIEPIDRWN